MRAMSSLPTPATLYRAVVRRDPAYEGVFWLGVRTTGIFCRPTCRARPPRPENVEFFADAAEAAAQGYRACKMCRPTEPPGRAPAVVGRLKELAAAATQTPLREDDLRELGIDPATARRQFRAHCGVTFAAYQRSLRMGAALTEMREGGGVTAAQLAAGFESGSGFREAVGRTLGARASKAAAVEPLCSSATVRTPQAASLS